MDYKKFDLIIFDADGTLRECLIPGQPCPNTLRDWQLKTGVIEGLSEINWSKTYFGVASNQAGIALGYLTKRTAKKLLKAMLKDITKHVQIPRSKYVLCPHAPEASCFCRKPQPGMLYALMRHFKVSPVTTLYVGDMESDRLAAQRAGVSFQWAWRFFGWPGDN